MSLVMVTHQSTQKRKPTAQQALTMRLLQPLVKKRRPTRVLVLRHELASDIVFECSETTECVSLSSEMRAVGAPIHARLSALPFEDVAFDLIVIQHLIGDGSEEVLREAMRVLAPGGDIIISGLNYAGLRYHSKRRKKAYPAIKINKVNHLLKSHSFTISHCQRAGFARMAWPKATSSWLSSSLPFSDRVAIQAHHKSGQQALRLSSLKKARTATISTALMGTVGSKRSMK